MYGDACLGEIVITHRIHAHNGKHPAQRRLALEEHYLRSLPHHEWPDFQNEAFIPWVDYIGLLWALLMAEQDASPDYDTLIALNRQRLE